jgi:hypothetical protein
MKTVIEMAREAGFSSLELEFRDGERLERFAALVREDEREKQQNHSGEAADMVQEPFGYFRAMPFGWEDCEENDEGAVALYDRPQVVEQQEPVAWMKNQFITDDAGFNIGTDDPEVHFGKDCPEDSGWWPVYAETISTQKPVVFRYKEYPLDTRSSWHYVTERKAIPDGFPFQELYTTPPTTAQEPRNFGIEMLKQYERGVKAGRCIAARQIAAEIADFCSDIDGGENMFSRAIRKKYGVE